MTRDDVLRELCALASKVGAELFNDDYSHDCFCAERIADDTDFRFERSVMDFIKQAVEEKMVREGRV